MKGFKLAIILLSLLIFFPPSWALKTKFDPTIYVNELRKAGIGNIEKIYTNLGLEKNGQPQALVVKHVITTGRNQINQNYILIDINTLEKISPKISRNAFSRQLPLSNEQMDSVSHLIKLDNNTERWLLDKSRKKYINVVLQKDKSEDNTISPITFVEAQFLIKWAIKNKRLDDADHPSTMRNAHRTNLD